MIMMIATRSRNTRLLLCSQFLTVRIFRNKWPLRHPVCLSLRLFAKQRSGTNRKIQRSDDTSPVDELNKRIKTGDDPEKPEYKPGDLARIFFGNPFFYYDKTLEKRQQRVNVFESDRETCFGDSTVKAQLEPLQSEDEVHKLFEKSGVNSLKVLPFWEEAKKRREPEDELHGKILSVTTGAEVEIINKRFVYLDSFGQSATESPTDERTSDIRFVLGPSGSGKTFFAVKVAAVGGMKEQKEKWVTVYYNLKIVPPEHAKDPAYVMNKVKQILQGACNRDLKEKLQLTLSLVLDEAGAAHFDGHFEYTPEMEELLNAIRSLAASVRLVLCGTGLLASKYTTGTDAIKYRMKPWKTEDLKAINAKSFELDDDTLDAILQHPNLQAMATNARAAYFLLERSRNFLTAEKKPETLIEPTVSARFQRQLVNYAPDIVRGVVADYINCNGIQRLNDIERRRVAAAIFNVIGHNETFVPKKWPGISSLDEQDVASSLVSINIEIDSKKNAKLVQNEKRPVSISPAVTIVVYWMCGVPIPMLSGWKAQEFLSALYECRRFMRDCVSKYEKEKVKLELQYNETDLKKYNETNESILTEYDAKLFSLQLIEISRKIPEPRATRNFYIPYVHKWTIWINKDMAPYADVVAPHALYQSKSGESEDSSVSIDMLDELGKCGLLKDSTEFTDPNKKERNEFGWAITKSLDHIWNMQFDTYEMSSANNETERNAINIDDSSMFFYPDKQMTWRPSAMDCRYATLKYNQSEWWLHIPDGTKKELVTISNDINLSNNGSKTKPVDIGSIDGLSNDLAFYISSNRKEISLTRQSESAQKFLTIKKEYLDNSGSMHADKLEELTQEERDEWSYYQDVLKEKVTIRFLLS